MSSLQHPHSPPAPGHRHSRKKAKTEAEPSSSSSTASASASPHSTSTSSPSSLSSRDEEQSSASLFAPSLPSSLCLRPSGDTGRSVLSTEPLPSSARLLRDAPVSLIQFQRNSRRVLACAQCGRFLSSLLEQLHQLMGQRGRQRLAAMGGGGSTGALGSEMLSAVVRCRGGCAELYCSEACSERAWRLHHQLLCIGKEGEEQETGRERFSYAEKKQRMRQRRQRSNQQQQQQRPPRASALVAFRRHALRHHQFFLMAAQVTASLVLEERRGGAEQLSVSLSALADYAQIDWWDTIDLDEGYDNPAGQEAKTEESETAHEERTGLPSSVAASSPSSPLAEPDDGYHPGDEGGLHDAVDDRRLQHRHELLHHLQHVVIKSFHLLARALFTSQQQPTPAWYSVSWYSRLLGLFRRNNVGVELRNPLCDYVEAVERLEDETVRGELMAELAPMLLAVMEERQRQLDWESRNEREEMEEEEQEEEEQLTAATTASRDNDSDDEDRSDSEDDESFRREDEDAYPVSVHTWPLPPSLHLSSPPPSQPAATGSPSTSFITIPTAAAAPVLVVPSPAPTLYTPVAFSIPVAAATAAPQPPSPAASDATPAASTITFSSTLFPSYHGSALYPTLSVINHSCIPNALLCFLDDARPELLVGKAAVPAGEELTIAYVDVEGVEKEERWKELQGYGFLCSCKRCVEEQQLEDQEEAGRDSKQMTDK